MATEKERLDAVEPTVASLVQQSAGLAEELRRLRAELTMVKARLLGAGSGQTVDMDAVDGELEPVVAVLRHAWQVEQAVLADSVRDALRQQVDELAGFRERNEQVRAQLNTAKLSRTDREVLEHEVHQLTWRIGARSDAVRQASERLAKDDRIREEPGRQEAIAAGDKARVEIAELARRRVEQVLAHDVGIPMWFRVAMGTPPSPDPSQWLAVAGRLLAYRLEYAVTDLVNPLGPKPDADADSAAWVRRREVFADLSQQLYQFHPEHQGK
ncbi:hypothetical protein [Goodfellowiella coeruleoviolacea]|uniref:Uncharacterized protein n=1 Tax=Goodfellowiella coeruleoviolacea TaxID=334858 RepID=A0AAE3GDW6_9PSEU|nr:hypothetical protein [Goodfellowiella coeruleoviolacea]MCP2166426.1 hypothetical protein [Goodfellowiella coeruleoviolacea]